MNLHRTLVWGPSLAALVLSLGVLFSPAARADIITYEFSGIITSSFDDMVAPAPIGETFVVQYFINTGAADIDAATTRGEYPAALEGVSVFLGGSEFVHLTYDTGVIRNFMVMDDHVFYGGSPEEGVWFHWQDPRMTSFGFPEEHSTLYVSAWLRTGSPSPLVSDDIPLTLDLEQWPADISMRAIQLDIGGGWVNGQWLYAGGAYGEMTSARVIPSGTVVPEPSSIAILAIGLAGIVAQRRLRRR